MLLKLSARGEYGLMVLKNLAKLKPNQYLSLKQMAVKQKLPAKYLERVAGDLGRAHLIKARQGAAGGYKLNVSPEKIGLVSILEILEGDIKPALCRIGCTSCKRVKACEKKTGWKKIHQELYKKLSQVSLADLINH